MKIYKCFDSGGIEELGELKSTDLPELLTQAVDSLGNNDFGIGAQRSEKDFVEVRPVGKDQFMVWSDRICKTGTFFQRLVQSGNIEKTIEGEKLALEVFRVYRNQSRESFEAKYT